jgi:FkbM family methyltransferase
MNWIDRTWLWLRFRVWAPWRINRYSSHYLSCSQFGEDMIVRSLLADVKRGYYVDIGAHHPVFLSNSYHFYCRGWRGLCVDAIPGSMNAFRVLRPRDTLVEACLGATAGERVEFHMFDQSPLNTTSAADAERAIAAGQGKRLQTITLTTTTLNALLDEHHKPNGPIDFLSIDIEGLDEVVLRGLDYERYRPRVIVFERHSESVDAIVADPLVQFLKDRGYRVAGATGMSVIMAGRS